MELLRQTEDMKEDNDLLILEKDEKEKRIRELETEIERRATDADYNSQRVQIATEEAKDRENRLKVAAEEAAEREKKLNYMKLERDMKEKEAAAHLASVEEKAKMVDKLEAQIVLINMDKDALKRELNQLQNEHE